MKTGRLSKQEWDFIERNADLMTPEQIANSLDRDLEPVQRHLRKVGKSLNKKEDFEVQAEYDLKSRPYYRELKEQFTEEELELFLYHWKQIVAQFKMDVLPTEELQIIDCVKLEVLSNRSLKEERYCITKVSELERVIAKEKKRHKNCDDPMEQAKIQAEIFDLEKQCAMLVQAKLTLSRDFKEIQDKKSKLYKDLKGTRDQRIERVENTKETFPNLVGKIMKDPIFREQCSLEMEKMRLAIEAEKERLSDYYQFEDTGADQCYLTPETVKD